MKKIISVFGLFLFASSAWANGDGYGYCQIIYPGQNDSNGYHCVDRNAFGVGYNGYFVDTHPCFRNYSEAWDRMRNSRACMTAPFNRQCNILFPGQIDQARYRCANPTYFGVLYRGYFYSNTSCYESVDAAISVMMNSNCN